MNYSILETYLSQHNMELKQLKGKTVSIAGLGGVGAQLASILVRNGVSLRIVDKARVDEKDMARTSLFIAEDITKFKAKQAKKRLEEIDTNAKIKTFHEDLHPDNVFLLDADLIIDTTNDVKASEIIDAYAKQKKIPVLFANYAGGIGNIVLFEKKQRLATLEKQLSLDPVKKTGVFSPVTGLIASILASETLKFLFGEEVEERLLKIDATKSEIKHVSVASKAPTKSSAKKTQSSKAAGAQKRQVNSKVAKKKNNYKKKEVMS